MGSVYHAMDYDMQFGEQTEAKPNPYFTKKSNKLIPKKSSKEITEDEFDEAAEKKDACYPKSNPSYKVWSQCLCEVH